MILQALNDLYDRLRKDEGYEIAPPGYSRQKIGFQVGLTLDGELGGGKRLGTPEGGNRPRPLLVPGGSKPSGAVTRESVKKKVCLLRNDLPFLLGCRVKEEKGENGTKTRTLDPAALEFEAFRDHHLTIGECVEDDHFRAVCRFLRSWSPERALAWPGSTDWTDLGASQGVFQVLGEESYVHQHPAVMAWWEAARVESAEAGEHPEGQCLVSGVASTLARIHEPKIKGVRGAQSAGATLVTFNEPAYESYGKEQSFNAPVSESVAFRYTTALNALTDGPARGRHRLELGDASVVFWTERPTVTEDVFARLEQRGVQRAAINPHR